METEFINKTIKVFLERLGIEATLVGVTLLNNGEISKFAITTDQPHVLIGHDGKVLMALNHLVKKVYERESLRGGLKPMNFIVDVNDYQEKQIEEIKNKAQMMAERARFFKNNVEMMPMNPYERMIIHSIFTNESDIETESTGKGRDRRVVIKYIEALAEIPPGGIEN